MPWRNPALPAPIRDAAYDAYAQGVRHRASGWTAERAAADGLREIAGLSAGRGEHSGVIAQAFWDGFNAPSAATRA